MSSTLATKGRVELGLPNTDNESCAAIALSMALRETLPDFHQDTAVEFVSHARGAFPTIKNPFDLLQHLAPAEFTIQALRWTRCGCPVTEGPQTGITYHRPSTTATQRLVSIQALITGLSFPHPLMCDLCKVLTTTSQTFADAPEYLAVDTPGHHHTPEGNVVADEAFPGVFHETRRPVYFNGAPYRTTAIICSRPNHFVTVVPRGQVFLLVDDDRPVRILRHPELQSYCQGTMVTLLARLHSKPRAQVHFSPEVGDQPPSLDQHAASSSNAAPVTSLPGSSTAAAPRDMEVDLVSQTPSPPLAGVPAQTESPAPLTGASASAESPAPPMTPRSPTKATAQASTLMRMMRLSPYPASPSLKGPARPQGHGPRATPRPHQTLTVASWNLCGFSAAKVPDVVRFLTEEKVDVLCVQELRWGPERTAVRVPGFHCVCQPRTQKGGGVALYLRSTLPHQPLPHLNTSGHVEAVYARLELGRNHLVVGSCYVPPPAVIPADLFAPGLSLRLPFVLGGDFNAHHEWWSQGLPTAPGQLLKDVMEDAGVSPAGLDSVLTTSLRYQGRPDLIVSADLEERQSWVKMEHISDHLPLLTTFDLAWEYPAPIHDCRPRVKFESADWAAFQRQVEASLDPALERSLQQIRQVRDQPERERLVEAGAAHLTQALQRAAEALPKSLRKPGTPPYWTGACEQADQHCSRAYALFQQTPTDAAWQSYLEAKHSRASAIAAQRKALFEKRVERLDPARAVDWRMVKSRDRGVDLRGTIVAGVSGLQAKANLFARHFAPKTPRHKLRPPRHAATPRVTLPEVQAALLKTRRGKAPGPDGIYPEHLRDGLGPRGLQFLTLLIDASLHTGYLPRAWKHAYWVPIPKPKKPPEKVESYRPVSLTSVLSKVAERVLDTRLRADPGCQLDTRQHGFRRSHRTADAIARLMDTANRAYNSTYDVRYRQSSGDLNWISRSGRASATLLDLTSAFDNMLHERLMAQLRQRGIPSYISRWINHFLSGRTAQVSIHGVLSTIHTLTRGTPQGTVLGPLLFLIYIDPLVEAISRVPKVDPLVFADDITLVAVGDTAADCARATQEAVGVVLAWCRANSMALTPGKTKAILFTHSHTSDETNPGIQVGPVHVPLTKAFDPECKMLGVHLDARLSFAHHVALTRTSATLHLRLLRLAVTQIGPSSMTLRTFGKALVESRLFYAAESWGAALTPNLLSLLEVSQRELARAITGVLSQAPQAGTLLEANLVPATVRVRTQAAALLERWRRLPPTDVRHRLANRPLPAPPTTTGQIPYLPHPWSSVLTLIAEVLANRRVPLDHPRLPVLVSRRTLPHQVAGAQQVTVRPEAVGAPPSLPEKGSEDGDRLRRELNQRTWEDLQRNYGPFTAEIWTDGGVVHAEHEECRSAAAGQLYLGSADVPCATYTAGAGRLACSYTAEFTALTGSLRQFAPLVPAGSTLLVGSDSQSLLQALAKGPLLTEEDHEDELWALFLSLVHRGCRLVIQFFYSHVSFPERNQRVDAVVSGLLEANQVDQDSAPIWLTDVVRAVHRQLYLGWLSSLEDARTALCGVTRAPLRKMAAWSRADQTLFSRSRTGALLEVGTYRLRVGLTTSVTCRWCGLRPPQPLVPEPPASPPEPAPPDPPPTPTAMEGTRHQCPHCEKSYAKNYLLTTHLDRAHPKDPRPRTQVYPCECGESFPSAHGRGNHRRVCAQWKAQVTAHPPPATARTLRSAESVEHLLECPGLSSLRQELGVSLAAQPPPLTEALTDHLWVTFLRRALALLDPPTGQEDPLTL
jgi:hypothetical protein